MGLVLAGAALLLATSAAWAGSSSNWASRAYGSRFYTGYNIVPVKPQHLTPSTSVSTAPGRYSYTTDRRGRRVITERALDTGRITRTWGGKTSGVVRTDRNRRRDTDTDRRDRRHDNARDRHHSRDRRSPYYYDPYYGRYWPWPTTRIGYPVTAYPWYYQSVTYPMVWHYAGRVGGVISYSKPSISIHISW